MGVEGAFTASSVCVGEGDAVDSEEIDVEAGSSSFSFLSTPEVKPEISEESIPVTSVEDSVGDGGFSFLAQPPASGVVSEQDNVGQDQTPPPLKGSEPINSILNQGQVDSTKISSPLPVIDARTSDPHSNSKGEAKKKVGHHLTPTSGEKKKKRKAIRPGLSATINEDSNTGLSVSLDLPPFPVSVEGNRMEKETTALTDAGEPSLPVRPPALEIMGSSPPLTVEDHDSTFPIDKTERSDAILPAPSKGENVDAEPPSLLEEEDSTPSLEDMGSLGKRGGKAEENLRTESNVNYMVEFSHEENLAGLLQSYSNGLIKFRYFKAYIVMDMVLKVGNVVCT